ncbi:hypothetical protein RhiirA5_379351 [Rhizophagus irregularis]|uniref:Uncharacterized protein n=1 Tax=Rhizophagus irregularis TaxID=588596 RepID=A0A2N0PCD5_9GLOM|nr:hypothetical protein RhiirA5_379351 [Rhizophagus irregularis]
MVRRHSFNRRARQDLKEFIRRSRRRDQCQIQGLDLVGIADVKNTRDIDDVLSFTDHTLANISREPPPFSGFRCHYMKRYDNINNGGVCRPLNYAHRTQQQALRCHRSHFCHGILDWKDNVYNNAKSKGTPPSYLEVTAGSCFKCHHMKRTII